MLWIRKEGPALRLLHNTTGIHDHHPVRDLIDDPQVMCNQEHGHVTFFLEILNKFQDLGLDGHI